jgi:hypothetical protein
MASVEAAIVRLDAVIWEEISNRLEVGLANSLEDLETPS